MKRRCCSVSKPRCGLLTVRMVTLARGSVEMGLTPIPLTNRRTRADRCPPRGGARFETYAAESSAASAATFAARAG